MGNRCMGDGNTGRGMLIIHEKVFERNKGDLLHEQEAHSPIVCNIALHIGFRRPCILGFRRCCWENAATGRATATSQPLQSLLKRQAAEPLRKKSSKSL